MSNEDVFMTQMDQDGAVNNDHEVSEVTISPGLRPNKAGLEAEKSPPTGKIKHKSSKSKNSLNRFKIMKQTGEDPITHFYSN